jgi:hypothetical protein
VHDGHDDVNDDDGCEADGGAVVCACHCPYDERTPSDVTAEGRRCQATDAGPGRQDARKSTLRATR